MLKCGVYFLTYAVPLASPGYIIQSKHGIEPKGNGNSWCYCLSLDGYASEIQKKFTKLILVYTVVDGVTGHCQSVRKTKDLS